MKFQTAEPIALPSALSPARLKSTMSARVLRTERLAHDGPQKLIISEFLDLAADTFPCRRLVDPRRLQEA